MKPRGRVESWARLPRDPRFCSGYSLSAHTRAGFAPLARLVSKSMIAYSTLGLLTIKVFRSRSDPLFLDFPDPEPLYLIRILSLLQNYYTVYIKYDITKTCAISDRRQTLHTVKAIFRNFFFLAELTTKFRKFFGQKFAITQLGLEISYVSTAVSA